VIGIIRPIRSVVSRIGARLIPATGKGTVRSILSRRSVIGFFSVYETESSVPRLALAKVILQQNGRSKWMRH